METIKNFFTKKSNIIMTIVIAALVIGGIVGAVAFSGKDSATKEAEAVVQEAEAVDEADVADEDDAVTEAETEDTEKKDADTTKEDADKKDASATDPKEDTKTTDSKKEDTKKDETSAGSTSSTSSSGTTSSGGNTSSSASGSGSTGSSSTTTKPTQTPAATAIPTPTATPTPTPEPTPAKKTCTITIRCDTILNNMGNLTPGKEGCVPSSGYIMSNKTVEFSDGETVYDVLSRACSSSGIQMEASYTPAYGSYYIEGINNLYEFDCGPDSGWKYKVNGWFPNYGCSSYTLSDGDNIVWCYTCGEE